MTRENKETVPNVPTQASLAAAQCSAAADTDPLHSGLKMAINNLIWMNATETITLGDADEMSNTILVMIISGVKKP